MTRRAKDSRPRPAPRPTPTPAGRTPRPAGPASTDERPSADDLAAFSAMIRSTYAHADTEPTSRRHTLRDDHDNTTTPHDSTCPPDCTAPAPWTPPPTSTPAPNVAPTFTAAAAARQSDALRRLIGAHAVTYESVPDLARMSAAELRRAGFTTRQSLRLIAAFDLAAELATSTLRDRELLNEPSLVKDYLRRTVAALNAAQEVTGALYLNARNRLINDETIYRGTLDRAQVEPREILKRALLANAAGFILYHNHPSGDPSPSREDREFTRRLAAAADSCGVKFLDHIVAGTHGCISFRECGLL